jgi:hypothetical protein
MTIVKLKTHHNSIEETPYLFVNKALGTREFKPLL